MITIMSKTLKYFSKIVKPLKLERDAFHLISKELENNKENPKL